MNNKVIFWFRRDLRLHDNTGLAAALDSGFNVMPVFIFDTDILDMIEDREDPRLSFIHAQLKALDRELRLKGSGLHVFHGKPSLIFTELLRHKRVMGLYCNRDYEPYGIERDRNIRELCRLKEVGYHAYKDHVVFEKDEVRKDDGSPYHVFTPFKRKWLARLADSPNALQASTTEAGSFEQYINLPELPELEEIGFRSSSIQPAQAELPASEVLQRYADTRNIPEIDTTRIGVHLRFGTLSIRELMAHAIAHSETWTSELIWREFFMQILAHYPRVEHESFRREYDRIEWRNDEGEFGEWCRGETGFPLVDAGMRELNATGFMHNRVRMVVASFLCKDLLIDWRWGEAYFASRLLDFELASNNGNWQWAAGTGCDAAPYFRVFNPSEQARKFDPELHYIKRWIPEFGTDAYPEPMVDHGFARKRAIEAYKKALSPE